MDPQHLAEKLWKAITSNTPILPLTNEEPELTVDGAYDVQDLIIALHQRDGAVLSAAKLGLTSSAKQKQMNVTEPLYGWLTDQMLVTGALDVSDYIQPRVEPEIAFTLGRRLEGPSVTAAEVLAATETVSPALDILDSRFAGYRFTLADVTADNSSAAGYVLGSPIEPDGDLRTTGCVFEKNGELEATAAGAAVMDHPAAAVAWFVRKLFERGRGLDAGMIVLAGAWTAAATVEPGDHFVATFDRIGSVELVAV